MANRPDWWPAWIPIACASGHTLVPGKVSLNWVFCDCPAAETGGHHVIYCTVRGCGADPIQPPGHTGSARAQR